MNKLHDGGVEGAKARKSQADLDRAASLLQIEADIRRVATVRELAFHAVNAPRDLLGFGQAVLLLRNGRRLRVEAISSISTIERDAPFVRWIEALVDRINSDADASAPVSFQLPAFADEMQPETKEFAFPHFLWVPLPLYRGAVDAGLLLARAKPWFENHKLVAARLAETYAHAWRALARRRVGHRRKLSPLLLWSALIFALGAAILIRVPITALALVEVVGKDPAVIAAPINGVIADVQVSPNQSVENGTILVSFEATELKNAYEISERQVGVATARLEQLKQGAFVDPTVAREIAIAEAELALAIAESDLARERLERAVVRSEGSGVAIFADRRALIGKPVAIGERIMQIADPTQLEFEIALSVSDQIVLEPDADVRVFLDTDPLNSIKAHLTRLSYRATPMDDGTVTFVLGAEAGPDTGKNLRLGSRGVASLVGKRAPVWFVVLRRPIAWFRQNLGL